VLPVPSGRDEALAAKRAVSAVLRGGYTRARVLPTGYRKGNAHGSQPVTAQRTTSNVSGRLARRV